MRSEYESFVTPESVDRRVVRIARSQYGLVTRAQSVDAGATTSMIQRRVSQGRWERLHRSVFRLAGHPPSWHQALLAACLAGGDGVCASHRAAARLWGFPGFEEEAIEVSVARGRRVRLRGVTAHECDLPAVDRTRIGVIPATTPARTLIDLCGVAAPGIVEEALDDALRRKLVSPSHLRRRLDALGGSGRTGTAAMRSLLMSRLGGSVPQSVFETRLLRAIRRAGLPKPSCQHRIPLDGATTRGAAVVDFAFPAQRLAVEADGYRWHSGKPAWERDLARRNALTAAGWRVVHVTWEELSLRPATVTRHIARLLAGG